jgi:hypothetical protein
VTSFVRLARVTVGTLRAAAPLRIAFEVERSVHGRGKARATVYNLTRSHQSEIEAAADAQLVVEAGYRDDRGLEMLFSGRVARSHGHDQPSRGSRSEGRDVATFVDGTDGGIEMRERRVSGSYGPGVQVATVARACADALGVGAGNLEEALAAVGSPTLPAGTVLTGSAARELSQLLASFDLHWSVQHGALQVLGLGGALPVEAVRLTSSTGLIGEPELGTRGRVRVTALLTPDIAPGRPVLLESRRASGRYVTRSARYTGDTEGDEWFVTADLRRAS